MLFNVRKYLLITNIWMKWMCIGMSKCLSTCVKINYFMRMWKFRKKWSKFVLQNIFLIRDQFSGNWICIYINFPWQLFHSLDDGIMIGCYMYGERNERIKLKYSLKCWLYERDLIRLLLSLIFEGSCSSWCRMKSVSIDDI